MFNPSNAALEVAPVSSSDPLQRYYQQGLDNVRQQLPLLAKELSAVGIVCVEVNYDGVGDSGQIESMAFFDKSREVPFPKGHVSLTVQQIEALFYDLLEARHPGWENEDGAFGEFRWDVACGGLLHTHHARFTDYETTEQEGV